MVVPCGDRPTDTCFCTCKVQITVEMKDWPMGRAWGSAWDVLRSYVLHFVAVFVPIIRDL